MSGSQFWRQPLRYQYTGQKLFGKFLNEGEVSHAAQKRPLILRIEETEALRNLLLTHSERDRSTIYLDTALGLLLHWRSSSAAGAGFSKGGAWFKT